MNRPHHERSNAVNDNKPVVAGHRRSRRNRPGDQPATGRPAAGRWSRETSRRRSRPATRAARDRRRRARRHRSRQRAAAVEQAAGMGPLRGVVNCAGVVRFTPMSGFDDADASRCGRSTSPAAARVSSAASQRMTDGGAIVNIPASPGTSGRLSAPRCTGRARPG